MWKVLKYSFFDMVRSRWTLLYFSFYLVFTLALFSMNSDPAQVVISLMNVILILCPLIAGMFGIMQYYNSREFVELLLAQPIRRGSIFIGQYLGIALSLSASLIIGVGLPFLSYGLLVSDEIFNFMVLIVCGVALTFVFAGLAYWIGLMNENRIRGFGLALLVWLFFALIYDGIFLLLLMKFQDYPLQKASLLASVLNPIDLSRIMILLKLDISAIMGYTGAVFRKFFGTNAGMVISIAVLLFWMAIPVFLIRKLGYRRDF